MITQSSVSLDFALISQLKGLQVCVIRSGEFKYVEGFCSPVYEEAVGSLPLY